MFPGDPSTGDAIMAYRVIVRSTDSEGEHTFDCRPFEALAFARKFASAESNDFILEDCSDGAIVEYRLGQRNYSAFEDDFGQKPVTRA
jgi:hypothetical protein